MANLETIEVGGVTYDIKDAKSMTKYSLGGWVKNITITTSTLSGQVIKIITTRGEIIAETSSSMWNIYGKNFATDTRQSIVITYSVSGGTLVLNFSSNITGFILAKVDDLTITTSSTSTPQANTLEQINLNDLANAKTTTTLSVDLTGWTQDTTSQSGTTLYKKQISVNNVHVPSPTISIGCGTGNTLPTVAEQESYNLLQYVIAEDTSPCYLMLFASAMPTTAFYINVTGVD